MKLDFLGGDGVPDLANYLDWKFTGNVSFVGTFSTSNGAEMRDSVEIKSGFEANSYSRTDVSAYLCDAVNQAIDIDYYIGQNFR